MARTPASEIVDRHREYVAEILETADRSNDPLWAERLREMADLLMEGIGEFQKRIPA